MATLARLQDSASQSPTRRISTPNNHIKHNFRRQSTQHHFPYYSRALPDSFLSSSSRLATSQDNLNICNHQSGSRKIKSNTKRITEHSNSNSNSTSNYNTKRTISKYHSTFLLNIYQPSTYRYNAANSRRLSNADKPTSRPRTKPAQPIDAL